MTTKKARSTSKKGAKARVRKLEARLERAEMKAARWKKEATRVRAEVATLRCRAAEPGASAAEVPDTTSPSTRGRMSAPDASWTVAQLRAEARARGISGMSSKPKAEIIAALS